MSLKERDIEALWNKYENLVKITKEEGFAKLVEEHGQRIVECSYSQKKSEPFCGIGGLISYSLEIIKTCKKLNEALEYDVNPISMIKVGLLLDLSRIGNLTADRFIICESEWHKEKLGQYFEWNESCPKYKISDMSLWYAQRYNIYLTWDEWQAIMIAGDITGESKNFYGSHVSKLAVIFCMSKQAVLKKESDIIKGIHTLPF